MAWRTHETMGIWPWAHVLAGWVVVLLSWALPSTSIASDAFTEGAPDVEAGVSDTLVCEGGWRFPLQETRRELGPARLARLLEIQKDIVISERAYDVCAELATRGEMPAPFAGACQGLLASSTGIVRISENLFGDSGADATCLAEGPRESGQCEQTREQLTTLRRYQRVGVERAELVASHEVCASVDRQANRTLRERCTLLESRIAEEAGEAESGVGRFGLSAPVPESIAGAIEDIRAATDGHFLGLVPEDALGVREQVCQRSPGRNTGDAWSKQWEEVRHSLCAELSIASQNAETCRGADIYIDERGQMHLSEPLSARGTRRDATLCIDISDFDSDHPLMITLGLAPASSVPERVWPGELVSVGHWLDEPVRSHDVLQLSVFGKARGVSLREVLRVNGVVEFSSAENDINRSEACRIARSWVPVVDHEVPIGPYGSQAVIPVDFGRGRSGSTAKIEEGDHLMVWVRDIEPSGAVQIDYADGQSVSYEPPPLLGKSESRAPAAIVPRQFLRGSRAGVDEPLLPRRARYPGSRVLRLGAPAGNSEYGIRICTHNRSAGGEGDAAVAGCSAENVIVRERLFVHGRSRMGVQLHVGYSFFRTPGLTARRTAAARAAGNDLYEIVEESEGRTNQDIAMLLAVYPFGRDPRDFSHRPWKRSYWRHASLLCGFSVRKKSFWEDVYLGASLPLANGISTSLLAHFSRREIPFQTSRGQFLRIPGGGDAVDIGDYVPTKRALSVGVGVGISFDLNLFQRAFTGVWGRISGNDSHFYGSGISP